MRKKLEGTAIKGRGKREHKSKRGKRQVTRWRV